MKKQIMAFIMLSFIPGIQAAEQLLERATQLRQGVAGPTILERQQKDADKLQKQRQAESAEAKRKAAAQPAPTVPVTKPKAKPTTKLQDLTKKQKAEREKKERQTQPRGGRFEKLKQDVRSGVERVKKEAKSLYEKGKEALGFGPKVKHGKSYQETKQMLKGATPKYK